MTWNGWKRIVGAGGSAGEIPRPTIPVSRASLCLDCEQVFEVAGDHTCPVCGSSVSWALRALLDREEAVGSGRRAALGGSTAEPPLADLDPAASVC